MSKNVTPLGQVCVLRLRCLGQSNSPTQVGNSPGNTKTEVRRQPLPILRISNVAHCKSLCLLWGVDLPTSHFWDILQGLVAEHFQISPQSLDFTGIIQIHWGMGNGSQERAAYTPWGSKLHLQKEHLKIKMDSRSQTNYLRIQDAAKRPCSLQLSITVISLQSLT